MKKYLIILFYGLLAWAIPFVASMFFYDKDGGLLTDIFLFKSIMIVVGTLSAAFLLVLYFRKVKEGFLKESVVVGVLWLIINYILDFIVLLPLSGMEVSEYFVQIGIRYLNIVIITVLVGYLLEITIKKNGK